MTDRTMDTDTSGRKAIRPVLWAVLPWIVGTAIGLTYDLPITSIALSCVLSLAAGVVLAVRGARTGAFAFLMVVATALGVIRASVFRSSFPQEKSLTPFVNRPLEAEGAITTDPRLTGRTWQFGFLADTVWSDSLVRAGSFSLSVRVDSSLGCGRIGERLRLAGRLRPLPTRRTPGVFDYGAYLRRRGFAATLAVHGAGGLTILPGEPSLAARWLDGARRYVRTTISSALPPADGGLMIGLLLGDRTGLPRAVLDQFQACGTVHVLAVSGLHVGIILVGVSWPLICLFGRAWWQIPLILAAVWGYAVLTGSNPAVIRASIMATVFLASYAVQRRFDVWNALALGALITLVVWPASLFDVGFQLSYAAVIGIISFGGAAWRAANRLPVVRGTSIGRKAVGLVIVTLAAQMAMWPLVAHSFHRVPVAGMVIGPAVVVLVTFAVWGGMLGLAVGWLPQVASFAFAPVSWMVTGIYRLSEWGAMIPHAAVWVRPPTYVEIAFYGLALWIVWQIGSRRGFIRAAMVGVLLLANLWVWSSWAHRRTGAEITFLDVGQGDAAVCALPGGTTMLVDGGVSSLRYDAGEWVVIPYLRSQGITRLDAVIASHADNDHIGGLASVIAAMEVGAVWYNGRSDSTAAFVRFTELAAQHNVPVIAVAAGDSVVGTGDAAILFVGPPRDAVAHRWWSDNDLSVALRLDIYGQSVLFTGDAGFLAERRMVGSFGERLASGVLKVSHHGSDYGTADTFLAVVRPEWGVVSAGRGNRYGHPAPALIRRLRKRGVGILRTDETGTLTWTVRPDTSYWRTSVVE